MVYNNNNKPDVTVTVSLFQMSKFGTEPEKNRLFSVQGLNYGVYISLRGMDDKKKFSKLMGGCYLSREDFQNASKLFELAAKDLGNGNDFSYELETKKAILGVKSEKHNDTNLVCITFAEKEGNKKPSAYYLPLRDAVKDNSGSKKVNVAYTTLLTLSSLFDSMSSGTNVKWENHTERVYKALAKAGGKPEEESSETPDDYAY